MDSRTLTAAIVLALLSGGIWWVAENAPSRGESGSFQVYVVGPDGLGFANGTVTVSEATALSVLQRLAVERGFSVRYEDAAGFGGCSAAYITGIGPYLETSTGGWNYYTRTAGEPWAWQPAGAGCGLSSGVDVEWCWVEHDVCERHVD